MMNAQMDAGEVFFEFGNNGQVIKGYAFALTQLLSMYGSGVWHVDYLYGYQTPSGREAEAGRILSHMINTLKINPQWMQMQQNITGNTSRIVSETNNNVSNIIQQSYKETQQSQEETWRKYSNALRGVEDVRDPSDGQTYQIESGKNYYWIDNLGNITGTDLYDNPDPTRFREMIRLD